MAELVIVTDTAQEMSAIVNIDERCGWGPAMIGPQSRQILEAFLETTPFDVTLFSSYECCRMFESFLQRAGLAADTPTADDNPVASQPNGSLGVDDFNVGDQADVSASEDYRDEQPSDTDMEADESTSDQVINCVNCNGTGTISFGDGSPGQQCGMCRGTGKLHVSAT